jgi:hypothetical protein
VTALRHAGDVGERGVLQPPGLGLAIHHRDESLQAAAHGFGQRHRRVVAGDHDHPVQQLVYRGFHRGVDEHQRRVALALFPRAHAHVDRLLQRELLVAEGAEHEVGGHQLGQRRRVGGRVGVALGQGLASGEVEQHVLACRDLGRLQGLGPHGQGSEGRGRGQQESEKFFH